MYLTLPKIRTPHSNPAPVSEGVPLDTVIHVHHPPPPPPHTHIVSGTLKQPGRKDQMTVAIEDQFIRSFILGTWHKTWLSEVIIKRVHNNVTIVGIVCPLPSIRTMHFFTGYAEELLTHILKLNVRIHMQCVNNNSYLIHKTI